MQSRLIFRTSYPTASHCQPSALSVPEASGTRNMCSIRLFFQSISTFEIHSLCAISSDASTVLTVNSPFRRTKGMTTQLRDLIGCILTMSAARGIDYITRDFSMYLNESPGTTCRNPHASALAHLRSHFETTGTQSWHKKSVEWFLIFLVTE